MTNDDPDLHALARAVLDGTAIDWRLAESSTTDESTRSVIRDLKVIADIAGVHQHDTGPAATISWGPLRLLEEVGSGTFGSVYRAWDTKLDREVALKLLHPEASAHRRVASAVIDEGRLLAQVRHPNVVTVHGADRCEDRVGIWFEFIRGRTLEQILHEQGPFEGPAAASIALDLCRALAAVHRAGVLHRDIKAHNLMREDEGRIVLMDFGAGLDRDAEWRSTPGLAGSPLYMAPEILEGEAASVRSDIYSVGVTLYHLVTADYPVHGRSVQEIRDRHARGERCLLRDTRPDLSSAFIAIVDRALAPKPEQRYESADAMAAALTAASAASVQTEIRRRPRWRALALVAGALLLGGLGLYWLPVFRAQPPPVIAVLPFKNLSVEPESDYFVDGLTDEVIRSLSVIDGLEVRSSTSSFVFKDKPRNTREVADEMHADHVLEASVLRVGSALRINAQLVRAADDVPIWSARFDRELKDIFAIQDEISRAIVNGLRLKLGRGQRRYTPGVEAYDMYLKARALQARRGPDIRAAIELFEQVIAKDRSFAPAHAALAAAFATALATRYPGVEAMAAPPDEARAIVHRAARAAIELDPLLAEAHDAMGWMHALDLEWSAAEASFRQALALNPRLTTTSTDYVLSTLLPQDKLDEALHQLESALAVDPLSWDVRRTMSLVELHAGLYDRALDDCRRVLAVAPQFPFANTRCEQALIHTGQVQEAITMIEAFIAETPLLLGKGGRGYGYLGYAYAVAGRRADAEAQLAMNEGYPHMQAMICGGLGDTNCAFEAIERLAAINPHRALSFLSRPELALLNGDPRVAALRTKFGVTPH